MNCIPRAGKWSLVLTGKKLMKGTCIAPSNPMMYQVVYAM